LVERGPEKAGVGGSIPSLATINFNNLASLKNRVKISRAHNTRTFSFHNSSFGAARSNDFQLSQLVLLVLAMSCRIGLASQKQKGSLTRSSGCVLTDRVISSAQPDLHSCHDIRAGIALFARPLCEAT